MIKKIVPATDLVLRKKSKKVDKVDKKVISLIKDLKDTLVVQENPEGIGLAACQIGKNIRLFIAKPEDKIRTFINPKILKVSDEKVALKTKTPSSAKKIMEGCLSMPHYYGPVKRPKQVKLEYLTVEGKKKIEDFNGLLAQIVQHEVDHLNGVLFIDHLLKQKQKLYELVDGKWEEVDLII